MTPGVIWILNTHRVIIFNYFVFIYSLNNLNSIISNYSNTFFSTISRNYWQSAQLLFVGSPCPFWVFRIDIPKQSVLQGCFNLYDLLSLCCLGPWCNRLPCISVHFGANLVWISCCVSSIEWRISEVSSINKEQTAVWWFFYPLKSIYIYISCFFILRYMLLGGNLSHKPLIK